jgi:hypothetical protein
MLRMKTKTKLINLIQLYKDRKISPVTTAEKQIRNVIEYNNAIDRRKKTIDENMIKIKQRMRIQIHYLKK